MQLRCKKSITYHWGSQYVESKDYLVLDELHNTDVCLITDYHRYFNDSRLIAASGQYLHLRQYYRNHCPGPRYAPVNLDLENLLPGYNQAIENSKCKKYESKVTLPFFKIQNEEGRYATFCILTHKEISELYGVELIDGEVSFTTTIDMADEYFDMTQYNRERKLGYLGIK